MQAGETASKPFLLATAKGFTGHSEAAAGAAGLTEAVLLLTHACAAPALHLRQLNPHVAGVIGSGGVGTRSVAVSRAGSDPVPSGAGRAPAATFTLFARSCQIASAVTCCEDATRCPTLQFDTAMDRVHPDNVLGCVTQATAKSSSASSQARHAECWSLASAPSAHRAPMHTRSCAGRRRLWTPLMVLTSAPDCLGAAPRVGSSLVHR